MSEALRRRLYRQNAESFPTNSDNRAAGPPRNTCIMSSALYLRANLELPCWDDVGESKVLRILETDKLAAGSELNLTDFSELRHIRNSFAKGKVPHPNLCERCGVTWSRQACIYSAAYAAGSATYRTLLPVSPLLSPVHPSEGAENHEGAAVPHLAD